MTMAKRIAHAGQPVPSTTSVAPQLADARATKPREFRLVTDPIDAAYAGLTRRLREVIGDRTNESVAEWAGCSAESIRRYLMGQPPPAKFLAAVCAHESICADWLLLGEGAPRRAQMAGEVVRASDLAALLAEIGRRLDGVLDRAPGQPNLIGRTEGLDAPG